MKKIHVNFMKDLRNHEFVELYNLIINYIEKQQVDDTNITTAFERMKCHRKKLQNMQKRKRSSFSIENKELTRHRNDYLMSLRLRVKSFLLSPIVAERDAANLIQFVLKPYGKEFYVATILPQTRLANDLENNINESSDFKDAVSLLGLNELMDTIFDLTMEIMINYNLRVFETGETKSKRSGVKKAAYRDMKIMADAINFMAVINEQDEEKMAIVEELVYYIDGILKDFRTAMRSRNTKRKNRKAVATAMMKLASMKREERKLLPVGVGDDGKDFSSDSAMAPLPDSGNLVSKETEGVSTIGGESVMSSLFLPIKMSECSFGET